MIEAETRGAWDVVVAKLRAFVERRVPASEVDDVVQDVLLRIHKSATQVPDEKFGAWVYAVARNSITDHYRRRSTAVDMEVITGADEHDDEQLLLACVAPLVARLPSPYREAMTLVELEALTQQAAAEVAGVSLSGMKSRVQRGRRLLRTMFDECCALSFDSRGRVIQAIEREPECACSPTEAACSSEATSEAATPGVRARTRA